MLVCWSLLQKRDVYTCHNGYVSTVETCSEVELTSLQIMNTLSLEPGDLLQVKSTDLPPGSLIKLEPQSPAFLDISDPRAVLENAFRNFSCMTKNDIFQFYYNDQVYDIKVLEIKPENPQNAIVTMETDLEVDFATPLGYVPPEKKSGTSTPRTAAGVPHGGNVHYQGTMAQSINYESIAPQATTAADGAKAVSSHFLGTGNKLKTGKPSSKAPTPVKSSTPVQGTSTNELKPALVRRTNGPQPLRLPPGKLFFGYEIKPVRKKDPDGEPIAEDEQKPKFQGHGQSLRAAAQKKKGTDSGTQSGVNSDAEVDKRGKLKGTGPGGRTLR